jgi:hypothetical protein
MDKEIKKQGDGEMKKGIRTWKHRKEMEGMQR